MGFLDKLLGRSKKATGDLTGAGVAEDQASQHEDLAQEQPNQAAEARAEQEQASTEPQGSDPPV